MRVALVQFNILSDQMEENRKHVKQLLEGATLSPNGLVVLPELFSTGFVTSEADLKKIDVLKVRKNDELFLKDIAKTYDTFVMGGTLNERNGLYENTSLLYSPKGDLVHCYVKVYPFSFGGEGSHFKKGEDVGVVSLNDFLLQPTICYDLRFPELYRKGRSLDASLITVQANWPNKRQHHWETLLKARAIENQSWVVGVNRVGSFGNLQYEGGSMVVSPKGEVAVQAGAEQTVLTTDLSQKRVEQWREKFPVWEDVRSEGFYG